MSRLRADILLLIVSIIWGTAFVAQKIANEAMSPLWFVGVRFLISAALLALPAFIEHKKSSALITRGALRTSVAISICLAIGACLQQSALVTASATNGGFLTAIYVVLVPFTSWMLTRERVRPVVFLAGLAAVAGAYLLGAHGALQSWSPGDVLLIVSDIAWAFAISMVAIFLKRASRPFFLAFLQFTVTGVVGVFAAVMIEGPLPGGLSSALPALLYCSIISGGIAYTLQVIAQGHTTAPEAALIMSLESIFAAITGALWLGERLTPLAMLGCALILLGVVAAEIGPLNLMGRRRAL